MAEFTEDELKVLALGTNAQHIFHHGNNEPSINAKLVQNTKGFNIEITVQGASTPEEAKRLIDETYLLLSKQYNTPTEEK